MFELLIKEQILKHQAFVYKKYFVYLKNYYEKTSFLNFSSFAHLKHVLINNYNFVSKIVYFMRFFILRYQSYYIIIINLFLPIAKLKLSNTESQKGLDRFNLKIFKFLNLNTFAKHLQLQNF